MTRVYIILLLLPLVSCGQSNLEFELLNSFPINLKEPVCINTRDCFYFSSDSNLYYLVMSYSDVQCEKKKLIDSVDFSPYSSKIHVFKLQKNNTYVVLWETEYEYLSILIAYYLEAGRIFRMGELEISLPCQSCESMEYPIKDIRIQEKKNEIEISFLKEVNYKEKNSSQWNTYKPGVLKFHFNKLSKEFKND